MTYNQSFNQTTHPAKFDAVDQVVADMNNNSIASSLLAHETIRNILEYVAKKLTVPRCSLFQILDHDKLLVVQYEWPREKTERYFSIPTSLRSINSNATIVMNYDDLLDSDTDLDFFKLNGAVTFLLSPLQNPHETSTVMGFLSFISNVSRTWTSFDMLLLEMGRDLISSTLIQPNIFINIDPSIAHLSVANIQTRLSDKQSNLINQICILFERMRRQSKIKDLWDTTGLSLFKDKLARFILSNQPINMALPAFPFKNVDKNNKVIGMLPDMAEALALANLNAFAHEVSSLYSPGCQILVISDGRVFNDLYPCADHDVSNYTQHIHSLGQGHLQFVGLDQMFLSISDNGLKRDAIVQLYGENVDYIRKKIHEDAHFNQVYLAFKMLLRNDVGEHRRSAAEKAKLMMIRNDSYSELIRILFPHHIRLSIHDHSSLEKISVHLVGDSIITPWHGVAVKRKDGSWTIMRKQAAIDLGCVLEDALSGENREEILHNDLRSLDPTKNHCFTSLLFYREI